MNTGFIYAIAAAVTWGLVYTIDQRILKGATPLVLLFINSIITGLILLPIIFLSNNPLASLSGISAKTWIFIATSIVLAIAANFFIFSSIKALNASTAAIFEISYPFFVVLFSYFAFKTHPNIYFLIGGILIFIGAGIIILRG